ncbi:hypothetical protein J6590_044674, partial [Homalodisca vitripennis]
ERAVNTMLEGDADVVENPKPEDADADEAISPASGCVCTFSPRLLSTITIPALAPVHLPFNAAS